MRFFFFKRQDIYIENFYMEEVCLFTVVLPCSVSTPYMKNNYISELENACSPLAQSLYWADLWQTGRYAKCMEGGVRADLINPSFLCVWCGWRSPCERNVNFPPRVEISPFLNFHSVVASRLTDVWDISQPWKVEPLGVSLGINSSLF
jgi:hypothetical protein